jgi:UDP-3-O-[3-hydroxymyristoyl] glucosamine N-acyltransferase
MMSLDSVLLRNVLGYDGISQLTFQSLGLSNSTIADTLTFLDSKQYVEEVNNNESITGVIVSPELMDFVDGRISKIKSDDPRHDFYRLHNLIARDRYVQKQSEISSSAIISDGSVVSTTNVVIGDGVVIEPNVTIFENVRIESNSRIGAGSVIGAEGFEIKRTSKGLLRVFHEGWVIIESNVEIGSNCTVDRGLMGSDTRIGSGSKLDSQIHIAHNVMIGKNCLLIASCCVLGSVKIGNDVWIGPATVVRNGCMIGDRSEITMGTIVSRDVPPDSKIVGKVNFPKTMTY